VKAGLRRAAILLSTAAVWLALPDAAMAQGEVVTEQELTTPVSIVHGVYQGAAVFLVGVVAFAVLVWLPVSRKSGYRRGGGVFSGVVWILFGVFALAGLADLSLFVVRASGQPLAPGLFWEALSGTRAGNIWLATTGLALAAVLLADVASRQRRAAGWWAATVAGIAALGTLAQQSHVSGEGTLAFLGVWVHLAGAALWTGGLLGIPVLLVGPLRKMESALRAELRVRTVRRFSRVATGAVMAIIATGLYASVLQIPSLVGLVGTSYGRALIVKLGLLTLLLAAGGINFLDGGQGPLGRMAGAELVLATGILLVAGFLSTLPPAEFALEYGVP
jgi:copper transport protein